MTIKSSGLTKKKNTDNPLVMLISLTNNIQSNNPRNKIKRGVEGRFGEIALTRGESADLFVASRPHLAHIVPYVYWICCF